MQARIPPQVYFYSQCRLTSRDVLARHKRLVHTRPEDREPPKKRGRPPKSSYATAENQARKDSTALSINSSATQNTAPADPQWPDLSTQPEFQFPKLDGEPQNGSFLTNPFNDNFGFGPIDTLSEFNFAEQDILSFLNPTPTRNVRDLPFNGMGSIVVPADHKPVVLQPDFVDWLQMNRDDYAFSLSNSSPRGLEGISTSPAPNLIEPNETKEMLVNTANPTTSVFIDEQTYANLVNQLQTKHKVRHLESI